jgi:hypothetical protein
MELKSSLISSYSASFSGTSTPTRSSWRPSSGPQGMAFDTTTFIDILSKRENLYRNYLNSLNLVSALPAHLCATPANPILDEICKGYGYVDPLSFSTEISREVMYTDLNFVKLNLVVDMHRKLARAASLTGINISMLDSYLFRYLLGSDFSNSLSKNNSLLKNQYRPLKKGVTNMVRLQATGAIAMPVEIRMHVLASSRDVIHS